MSRTPLQKWAWNRFQLKGFATGSVSRIKSMWGPHLTHNEKERLSRVRFALDAIVDDWDSNQERSKLEAREREDA